MLETFVYYSRMSDACISFFQQSNYTHEMCKKPTRTATSGMCKKPMHTAAWAKQNTPMNYLHVYCTCTPITLTPLVTHPTNAIPQILIWCWPQ